MVFNLILFKFMLFCSLSYTLAAVITKDKGEAVGDLQTSATTAKLLNLGSWLGAGHTGYYPNNYYRPGCSTCYGVSTPGCYCPSIGRYPTGFNYPNSNHYPNRYNNFYPNNNFYPSTYYPMGTNILGGGYGGYGGYGRVGGYGGYGGYGGNGGLRQYYGYYDPYYAGQRNLGQGYYSNTNHYGLYRDRK